MVREESRRFTYSTTASVFTELDGYPFTALDSSSQIAVWRKISGNNVVVQGTGTCAWPPNLTGIPPGWVLSTSAATEVNGVLTSGCPVWVAPSSLNNNTTTGLFLNPTNLVPTLVYFTGDGQTITFDTHITPLAMSYTLIAIDGITQHKDAYDVQGTYVIFSEAPPPGTLIEVIVYVVQTNSGVLTQFTTDYTAVVPDGVTTKFVLTGLTTVNGRYRNPISRVTAKFDIFDGVYNWNKTKFKFVFVCTV